MEYLIALVPSAGVLFLFWVAIRAMLRADRSERAAAARWEREQAAGQEASVTGAQPDDRRG